jgi:hypothetical protein
MIWQCGVAAGLIRLNKFVSRSNEDFCNLFYYYYPNTRCEAIRTAPLSKHISKEIFCPNHPIFSTLYQLFSHPYLLYIILYINKHLISSLLSLFLSPSLSHARAQELSERREGRLVYCTDLSRAGLFTGTRCRSVRAIFGVQLALQARGAHSLTP